MKAIIMAGGEGTRLRPLTCDCPKPMMPLLGRPIMEYAVMLLAQHGIRDAAATLRYLPDAVTDYFGQGIHGVNLTWYREDAPLGTAGGIRRAKGFLDETFLVLSGDGVTDLDVERALAFHREKSAMATIVLKRVEDPLEYGVVVTDQSGRVKKFLEKPDWREAVSDTVNTGIYILEPEVLELIPEGSCDFGRDLFPKMVAEGLPVYGYVTDAYWCDVGGISAYLACHMDALDGKIRLPGLQDAAGEITISETAQVDAGARLIAPCWIGPGARVERGAEVGAYTALGAGACLSEDASAKRSVIWDGARLLPGSQARGAVLAGGACLERGAQAYEESAIGTGAVASERCRVMPGGKIWPGKATAPASRLEGSLIWGSCAQDRFLDGRLTLSSPAHATRAGEALARETGAGEILLARANSAVADAMWHAVASGLMAQGARVLDGGSTTLPGLRHGSGLFSPPYAAYVTGDQLIPMRRGGAPASDELQRRIASLIQRQDFPRPFAAITRPVAPAPGIGPLYTAHLAREARHLAMFPEGIAVFAPDPLLLELAEEVFRQLNVAVRLETVGADGELERGEVGIWLDEGGESGALLDENGALSESESQLMLAWTAVELGEEELLLPPGVTRGALQLAKERGRVARAEEGYTAWREELFARHPRQAALWFDGLAMGLCALSSLGRAGLTLAEWRRSMPRIHRRSRAIDLSPADRGRVLSALSGGERDDGDGWACVLPDSRGSACRVITESRSMEHSRELFDFMTGEIARVLREK